MKTLILIRHTKAEPQEPEQADIDRPLAERGKEDAKSLGEWLRRTGHVPEQALVSPALRTQETWEALELESDTAARFPTELYDAAPSTYLRLMAKLEADSLLMVGHNPEIGDLMAHLLRGTEIPDELAAVPTGATAVIGFDAETWDEATKRPGKLIDWTVPKLLRV